jgi:hypothetical protein
MMVRTTGNARGYLPDVRRRRSDRGRSGPGRRRRRSPTNWTIGSSFFQTCSRASTNAFVDAFRGQAARTPTADCGLRNPGRPDAVIAYRDGDGRTSSSRLPGSSSPPRSRRIHTTEWTPQLLYDEPLHRASNANWGGLLDRDDVVSSVLDSIVVRNFGTSASVARATAWYSAFALRPRHLRISAANVYARQSPRRGARRTSGVSPIPITSTAASSLRIAVQFPEEFVTV